MVGGDSNTLAPYIEALGIQTDANVRVVALRPTNFANAKAGGRRTKLAVCA